MGRLSKKQLTLVDIAFYACAIGFLVYLWIFAGTPAIDEKILYMILIVLWVETRAELRSLRERVFKA